MKLGHKDALLVIDMQLDFLPGDTESGRKRGVLAVPDGDAIIPGIADLMRNGASKAGCIVVTQDWHPPEHKSFADVHGKLVFETIQMYGQPQVLWPVHCVGGTPGARLHPDIPLEPVTMVLRKGMNPKVDSYSAFQENIGPNGMRATTGLAAFLRDRLIENVYVCGLAADYCVRWTAVDAAEAGFHAVILRDLTRAVSADTPEKREQVLRGQEAADLFLQHKVYCAESYE